MIKPLTCQRVSEIIDEGGVSSDDNDNGSGSGNGEGEEEEEEEEEGGEKEEEEGEEDDSEGEGQGENMETIAEDPVPISATLVNTIEVTDPDGMWVNLIYIIFYSFIYI